MSYQRDLSESKEQRREDAARAVLAACYDPITYPANWPDLSQLSPMARERLMRIVDAAIVAAPGGADDAKAIAWMDAVRNHLINPAEIN